LVLFGSANAKNISLKDNGSLPFIYLNIKTEELNLIMSFIFRISSFRKSGSACAA
jgi:hypothetical protein